MSNRPNPNPQFPDTTPSQEPARQQPPRPGDPVPMPPDQPDIAPLADHGMLQLIKNHVGGAAFQPEEVRISVAAFDAAWQYVQRSGAQPLDYPTEEARNLIAKIIIEAGCQGERDEHRLTECALLGYTKFKNRM
jgi:hypothetical protein